MVAFCEVLISVTLLFLAAGVAVALPLEQGFVSPPCSARPWTWWHWMNGNVTKAGITADLEAMRDIGLGGAQIFDAKLGCLPEGPVRFNSPEWFEALDHAVKEAKRLGLTLGIANCSGWSLCGGPWVTPEHSMKILGWTETPVKGPSRFNGKLPHVRNPHGFYRDIAVLACPVPPAEAETMARAGGVMTASGKNVKVISFERPFRAGGFSVAFSSKYAWELGGHIKVETSDDGQMFSLLCNPWARLCVNGSPDGGRQFFAFPKRVAARHFRLTFDFPENAEVRPRELRLEGGLRIPDLSFKTLRVRAPILPNPAVAETDQMIGAGTVVDLTERLLPDGCLSWDVPDGDWCIVRLGYVANGRKNHPATSGGRGLEIDKLSRRALDAHFDAYLAKVPAVDHVLVDSYEVGSMNWTEGMEDAFVRRTGYSMRPYLAVLTGRVIGSVNVSEKFLADFRRTIAGLFAENFAGQLARRCHDRGLRLALEPYGNCPSDDLEYGGWADLPMGEFWSEGRCGSTACGNARMIGYLSHFWGRGMAGMEAFTARPGGTVGRWQNLPCQMKTQGDRAYSEGVNRIVYHRFVHQPWGDDKYVPGLTMGRYGTHFDRTQTWWREGREWVLYQTRCQYLLQAGRPVSDVLICLGDSVPRYPPIDNCLPYGYSWDVCSTSAFAKVRHEPDGTVVSPGGARYRLVLGEDWESSAVRALARKGLTPDFTCSLQTGPKIRGDSVTFTHRDYGDWGDGYFLAYPRLKAAKAECSFRISGRRPWLWNPLDGSMRPSTVWREKDGRTWVTIDFEAADSVFVMFPRVDRNAKRTGTIGPKPLRPRYIPAFEGLKVTVPWRVSFSARYPNPPAPRVFGRLYDWTESADRELKFFSGTATYECVLPEADSVMLQQGVRAGKMCLLDLGDVRDFATVSVNGRDYPTLWKTPFVLDVSEALRTNGPARIALRVHVTNRWPNRLIGDAFLPEDCSWQKAETGFELVEIPAWVKEGKTSPTGRKCFTTWRHWDKDDAPLTSGLLGPVRFGLVDSL